MLLEVFRAKKERKRISILCLGLAAVGIISLAVYTLLLFVLAYLGLISAGDTALLTWLSAGVQYGLGFPAACVIMRIVAPDPLERHSLTGDELAADFLILCFLLMAGQILGMGVNGLLELLLGRTPYDPVESMLDMEALLPTFVTTVILAPITEEILFRKLLLDRVNRLGDLPAILLSGFLFGVMHANFYQFFYAFLVGMLFARIYLQTGNIRYCIGLHCLVNLLFGMVSSLLNVLESMWEPGAVLSGTWFLFEMLLAAAGLIVLMVRLPRLRLLRGWLDVSPGQIFGVCLFNVGMGLFLLQSVMQFLLLML